MAVSGSLQVSLELGICRNHERSNKFQSTKTRARLCLSRSNLPSALLRRCSWGSDSLKQVHRRVCTIPHIGHQFRCHCFLNPSPSVDVNSVKNATLTLARSLNRLQGSPVVIKLASAVGIVIFAVWGLGPLVQLSRNVFMNKTDNNWKKSNAYQVTTSYIQPLLLWTGAIFICSALDPMILPTEAGQIVKQRLLNFIRSLSTVLAFAYCLSSLIQQAQKFFMQTNASTDNRNMGFQFAGNAIYTAVWVAAVSLFMELLGFSTQKLLTAGGLGTVLLTLAGREIFTNFLSSAIIHATRPFVVNEWIQTKIEGYEISGTVEEVGWWSPTVVRGEDREAVHIPNHKLTMNVVRNLTQKSHWRIKTHIAISHLDVGKISTIVADMRKVLAKSSNVEQQKLHRRVFLDNINPENQALMILVSCFVKTSHFEEYLRVKETILLDLLRVIRHHRARLATPIRTIQKVFTDSDLDSVPFSDTIFTRGTASSNSPLLLVEPSYKVTGEDKPKSQTRSSRPNGEEDIKVTSKSTLDLDTKTKDDKASPESGQVPKTGPKEDPRITSASDPKPNSSPKPVPSTDTQKTGQEINLVSSPDSGSRKPENASSTNSHSKQDSRQQPITQTKPSLEENIVLGVALEGSKRTLPIEEEMVGPSSSSPEDVKELAKSRSGNRPPVAEKDKNDVKNSGPGSAPSNFDQVDQQD
ncbi:Mechanosensitive ion channel protein 2-chloroplastic [Striga hermonthica]|uniref:Mechanosensitive ion channel protein 2-chloroplastic n=1 Tax=Striga hermonthica TaxID=68872 RepID=A0A9N7RIT8_STRHE|nr:Mechanosensitive ion channel protein 2-chloroplastic [Striga hermonthica]